MTELPLWAGIVFSVLLLGGAALTLLGCLGLSRFQSFYARVHAPTMGTSFGMVFVALASAVYYSVTQGRIVVHEILIIVFVTVTTPVTLILLARAALYRDQIEGKFNDNGVVGPVPPGKGE